MKPKPILCSQRYRTTTYLHMGSLPQDNGVSGLASAQCQVVLVGLHCFDCDAVDLHDHHTSLGSWKIENVTCDRPRFLRLKILHKPMGLLSNENSEL
jgi:hypothetical protein